MWSVPVPHVCSKCRCVPTATLRSQVVKCTLWISGACLGVGMTKYFLFLIFALHLSVMTAIAQQNDAKQAAESFAKGDYSRSIELYSAITKANPHDAGSWEQLGLSYHQSGKYDQAASAFERALQEGFTPGLGKYNLACAYSRLDRKDDAIRLLAELVAQRLPIAAKISGDPDLKNLQGDPRFAPLAEQAQFISEPCRDTTKNPEFRQFDFWVGEWDVFSGNQKVGDSSVQLILKDCVVFENWTSKLGREGKSFNKYDPANKYWQQYWVADNGSTTVYTGNLQNGEMRYHAEQPMANGGKMMQKLTFSRVAVDKVRQFQQFSTDGGKTWTTGYDFLYVRKSRSTLRTVPSAPDTQQDRSPAALSAGRIPSASI